VIEPKLRPRETGRASIVEARFRKFGNQTPAWLSAGKPSDA
jgi:hypothetical protein